MKRDTQKVEAEQSVSEVKSVLEEVLRQGAREMLLNAVEAEVAGYIDPHSHWRDEAGQQRVVRNGHWPEREILTGIGSVPIRQPRVNDKRRGQKFTSHILPPLMRRVPRIDAWIPCLYLKGVSTGDFSEALEAILGPQATGLSATNIVRLKEGWKQDCEAWNKRDLSDKQVVYIWVDGIYFNVRLDDERSCILVILGATQDGTKELLAVQDGYRESKLSWQEILRDLKARGLEKLPALATGDGALGFWAAAAEEEFPATRRQRCWAHKTANILDKMPRSVQSHAKLRIHDMYMADTQANALKAYDAFLALYGTKYPRACECLSKDQDDLFTVYDFPAEHWIHIRTTHPIESTLATVRLRTQRTKGCGSRTATLTLVFKRVKQAEKQGRRMTGHALMLKLIEGVKFKDGIIDLAA